MKQKRSRIGYIVVGIVLAMAVGMMGALAQSTNSTVQAVNVVEKATVVESPFTQAVREVRDSVVGVSNYGMVYPSNNWGSFGFGYGRGNRGGSGQEQQPEPQERLRGEGSGVVIAPGYVLTNYHVVEEATRLEVSVGEDIFEAVLLAQDDNLDLAVLSVKNMKVQPVVLGDSDVLNVGDWAICIGHPLSFTGTTTVGVISGLNREVKNSTTDRYGRRTEIVNSMIQTDAAINSGNSGGGMFNVAGELVGIPSMKFTSSFYSSTTVEGIGMAIPINVAKPLIAQALEGKTVPSEAEQKEEAVMVASQKPRIGVSVSDLNPSSYAVASGALPNGAYIIKVEEGSPAEKAGLKVGDIVVEVDGTVTGSMDQMIQILQAKKAGEIANIKAYRVEGLDALEQSEEIPAGEYMDFTVELAMLDDVKQ